MNITLKIFNHSFKLECDDAQAEQLREAAAKLELKLLGAKATTPKLDNERIAILVALELCQQQMAQAVVLQDQDVCLKLLNHITVEAESILGHA